jgi:prepilin-type N-terminal cleavage/methylation domain-containing protein
MKIKRENNGYTLIEVMMSLGIFLVAGGMIYTGLNTATVLYVKNTSVNSAHAQMLKALERITRDVHASASSPQLVNVNRAVTTGPAAGITIQPVTGGPFALSSLSMLNGSGTVTILTGSSPKPQVGQRVICPSALVEDYITAVAPNATNPLTQTDLTTANSIWTTASLGTNLYYPVFITNKSAYVVNGGELRYYPISTGSNSDSYVVLARGVTTPTPFTIVNGSSGTPTNSTIGATLTVIDPTYNQRGYKATDLAVTLQIPYRSRVAIYP